ncbi:hypothetical protein K435DRAFT_811775 [Dendrothele bispora CBS 962.96]|uniref:hAT-like transposase RNase-H fold domain-containing protein n=1 Tax=Dendrothele bispora (strain CBS 962.96) TaxID=1314807 RepID=A0A4S8KRD6_DENBC|nr:hypothetical protein K435DRAFT_811775 [Dendrothele bispora CBS 962.96]
MKAIIEAEQDTDNEKPVKSSRKSRRRRHRKAPEHDPDDSGGQFSDGDSELIFRELQSDIKQNLMALPDSVSPRIKEGLVAAHRKLSDYYTKFDESPFYLWASLLDPRISFIGLKQDYKDDEELLSSLNKSKEDLHDYYTRYYANAVPQQTSIELSSTSTNLNSLSGSPQKRSFTTRYKKARVSGVRNHMCSLMQ